MANTLTNLQDKILAKGLMVLRQRVTAPRFTNTDYSTDAKQFGDTIDVPLPLTRTAAAVTPSSTPLAPSSLVIPKTQVQLNQWYHSDFHLTDKEAHEIDANARYIPTQLDAVIDALARQVNASFWSEAKYAANSVRVGTSTWATAADDGFFASDANLRAGMGDILQKQSQENWGTNPRYLAVSPMDWGDALTLDLFVGADRSGSRQTLQTATMPTAFGMEWMVDNQVPNFTPGTGSGYLVNNGAGYVIGDTSITVDTGTGTMLVGDKLTFAGHTGGYVVVTALAANVVVISPPLRATVADNEAITVVNAGNGAHRANIAFHRDAFAFAMRNMASDSDSAEMRSMQDPESGLVLRIERMRQYKQWVWDIDCLWGVKCIRPELAIEVCSLS